MGLAVSCALVALATLAAYGRLPSLGFVGYDDPEYVTDNPSVEAGLTARGLAWALTTFHAANWHPLTWLSHMADCQLFGLDPLGHHLTSLLLHVASACFLLIALRRLTGDIGKSAFVAALFALHPLHVESVAWVAERKDVLSTVFWALSIWAYARYVERPAPRRYLAVALFFILSLAAKPMAVTLPFLLLLLDFWPLRRSISPSGGTGALRRCVAEKIPLFALAAASCAVTILAQAQGRALEAAARFPIGVRLANAAVSYVAYVYKTLWPARLAVFYPHPGNKLAASQAIAAFAILVVVTAAVVLAWRRRPYLAVGWFWYLGTLVPVIGLVQAGEQAMADRYTYVPLTGLFIMVAWGVPDLASLAGERLGRSLRVAIATASLVWLAALAVVTWRQVGFWRNGYTLFEHALAVTQDNYLAHYNLGTALAERGERREAELHLREAVRIEPDDVESQNNLGVLLAAEGKLDEAIDHYNRALAIRPRYAEGLYNLGTALAARGSLGEAEKRLSEALRLDPDFTKARRNLATVLLTLGDRAGAREQVRILEEQGIAPDPALVRALSVDTAAPAGPPGR